MGSCGAPKLAPQCAKCGAGKQPEQVEGRLQLDRVCFAYPSRASVPVFQNFSLTVEAGQTVALVGPSGSGELMQIARCDHLQFTSWPAGAAALKVHLRHACAKGVHV